MRVRAAHEDGVALGLHGDVVGVLTGAGKKTVVFFATNRLTDMREVGKI
jgi:hypothetical protein